MEKFGIKKFVFSVVLNSSHVVVNIMVIESLYGH